MAVCVCFATGLVVVFSVVYIVCWCFGLRWLLVIFALLWCFEFVGLFLFGVLF